MKITRNRFSLPELLLVAAVSALLIAGLSRAVPQLRESAKLVRCAGNLKQVIAGQLHYAADNDGVLLIMRANGRDRWPQYYGGVCGKYIPFEAMTCPESSQKITRLQDYFIGYGIRWYANTKFLVDAEQTGPGFLSFGWCQWYLRPAKIAEPERYLHMADASKPAKPDRCGPEFFRNQWMEYNVTLARHNGFTPGAYIDGHVDRLDGKLLNSAGFFYYAADGKTKMEGEQ